jgi:hypothetical protein
LVTNPHQISAKIDVKLHLLIRFEPRVIIAAKRLQWGRGIAAEVPTTNLIAAPKRGIQYVGLLGIECELQEQSVDALSPELESDLHDTCFDIADPSHGFLACTLIEQCYICGVCR